MHLHDESATWNNKGPVRYHHYWWAAVKVSTLPPEARLIAAIYRDYASSDKHTPGLDVWVQHARLVSETGLCKATVTKYVDLMRELGWLSALGEQGRGKRARFALTIPAGAALPITNKRPARQDTSLRKRPRAQDTDCPAGQDATVLPHRTRTPKNPKRNPESRANCPHGEPRGPAGCALCRFHSNTA